MQYNENASFNSSGGMSYDAEQAAPAEAPAYADDSMPMPMPAPEAAPEDGVSGSQSDIGAAPGAADAPGDMGTTSDAGTIDPAGSESERTSQEPASSADLTSEQDNFGTFSDLNETEVREMPWELVENMTLQSQEEAFITDVLSNASQWIVVTGELPQYLAERELVNLGPQFGWDIIAEIPSDDVQALLAELEDSDSYKTAANMNFTSMANSANLSAPNAVVLYSPEP